MPVNERQPTFFRIKSKPDLYPIPYNNIYNTNNNNNNNNNYGKLLA